MEGLNEIKTIDEAAQFLRPRFKGMEHHVRNYTKDDFKNFCHSQLSGGIGMQIRNKLKLWEENSKIMEHAKEKFDLSHPDDVSGKIIEKVYDNIENEILK